VYWNSADQDSGSEEHLGFALTLAVRPPSTIHLELRPEITEDAILQSGVPGEGHAQALETTVRATRYLPWSIYRMRQSPCPRDGRRENPVTVAVAVVAGRRTEAHEHMSVTRGNQSAK
jgi:hypothetical protein